MEIIGSLTKIRLLNNEIACSAADRFLHQSGLQRKYFSDVADRNDQFFSFETATIQAYSLSDKLSKQTMIKEKAN